MQRFCWILASSLVITACGDDDAAPTTTATPTTTSQAPTATTETPATTTEAPTTTIAATTTEATPPGVTVIGFDGVESTITGSSRIVSLSGDFTEILFALGLGDRVVATDITTTFPEEAKAIPQIGFGQAIAPEPVLAFEPDVVLANELTGPAEAIEQIRQAGIPVVVIEMGAAFEAVETKIETIGEIVGLPDEAAALASQVMADIDAAVTLAASAEDTPRVAFIYSRGPQLILLFGPGIATNAMITGANAIDIGGEVGVFGAMPLTPEALIAGAPDIIVLPTSGIEALGGTDALLEIPAGDHLRFDAIGMDPAAGKLVCSAGMTGLQASLVAAGIYSIFRIKRRNRVGPGTNIVGGISNRCMATDTIRSVFNPEFYLSPMKRIFIGVYGFETVTGHFFAIFMTACA